MVDGEGIVWNKDNFKGEQKKCLKELILKMKKNEVCQRKIMKFMSQNFNQLEFGAESSTKLILIPKVF